MLCAAQAAQDQGRAAAAANQLEAFEAHLAAQRGKNVPADEADLLRTGSGAAREKLTDDPAPANVL
ncbi:hypothetical protein [Georgenia sp. AZ-5]|uniref:hypothetical protein n=1 Tax=Georgenia sp. AZ-5 TaxID=3367526 RepID=UPI00375454D9